MNLNKDVLKRTAGMLAEIDLILTAPSVAERVERVLSSACGDMLDARLSELAMENLDEILHVWENTDGENNDVTDIAYDRFDADGVSMILDRGCDCENITVTVTNEALDGRLYISPEHPIRECRFYTPDRVYPIGGDGHVYNESSAAKFPCGADDCGCTELLLSTPPYTY